MCWPLRVANVGALAHRAAPEEDHGDEQAVAAVVAEGKTLTYDLVGEERASPMSRVGNAVRAELKARLQT